MAKVYGLIALLFLTGCKCEPAVVDTSAFLAGLDSAQAANEIYSESIIAKQDEHTTALAAIKSQVESLSGSILETRQAVGTMEASLVKSGPNGKDGDPASATEPQEIAGEGSQLSTPAASPPAVRLQFFTQENCAPCKPQRKNAEAAAKDLGIELEVFDLADGSGPFETASISETPTTVIVIDDQIRVKFLNIVSPAIVVARVNEELGKEATTAQPVGSFPAYTKASAVISQRTSLRPDNRQGRRGGRAGNQAFSWFFSSSGGRW